MPDARLAGLLLAAAALVTLSHQAAAQSATLDANQQLGRRLFTQSCGVCHLKPQITASQYGPVLSKETLSGDVDAMQTVIANGTPRMPGFKHHFTVDQIKAIAVFLKSVPAPAPAGAAKAKGGKSTGNDDD